MFSYFLNFKDCSVPAAFVATWYNIIVIIGVLYLSKKEIIGVLNQREIWILDLFDAVFIIGFLN